MEKKWFTLIENKEEGPFSFNELKSSLKITPDTLVKKRNWRKWIPIRAVPELQELFKDPQPSVPLDLPSPEKELTPDQEALTISEPDPFSPFLWILLIVILIIYLWYLASYR